MASANDMGVTEISATTQNIIAALVQKELIENGVIYNSISDFSSWLRPGAAQVSIPRFGSFSVSAKSENTASTGQKLTAAADAIVLTLNHVWGQIEDAARYESIIDLDAVYMERMASAMANKIEATLEDAVIKTANDIQLSGASNLIITKADIVGAIEDLDNAKVPQSDRYLLISPAQKAAMLNIDDFVLACEVGNSNAISKGAFGQILGLNVIMTTQFASASEACVYHKSHVGFVLDPSSYKFEKKRASLADLADELSLCARFGAKQLDSGNRGIYIDETATS